MEEKIKLFKELQEAKQAVSYCLKNANGNVGFHGLQYWAGEVERLRKEVSLLL